MSPDRLRCTSGVGNLQKPPACEQGRRRHRGSLPKISRPSRSAFRGRPARAPRTSWPLGLEKLTHSRALLNFVAGLEPRRAPGMSAMLIAPHPTPTCSGLTSLGTREPEPRSQPEGGAEPLFADTPTSGQGATPQESPPPFQKDWLLEGELSRLLTAGPVDVVRERRSVIILHPGSCSPVAWLASMRKGCANARVRSTDFRPSG